MKERECVSIHTTCKFIKNMKTIRASNSIQCSHCSSCTNLLYEILWSPMSAVLKFHEQNTEELWRFNRLILFSSCVYIYKINIFK